MKNRQKSVLYSRDQIRKRVEELALQISRDYEGKDLLLVGVLKGAFIFMADLIRCMKIPSVVDFIRVASYGASTESCGQITITKDIEVPLTGKDVLIVEDIVDSGITLDYLVKKLKDCNPASLKVCALIDKRGRRKVPFEADYVGFTMDDGFIVGYGLDFNEMSRFHPDIYVIED
jgi:hypoxanthine phosphoribosyltransferase